jgi:hypothetical protein
MSKDEIRKLLGGYATQTLTPEEERILFEAAMDDQELFDALADEQSLRELLADPAARRELHQALVPQETLWARTLAWFRKPPSLVLAGGLATALIMSIAIKDITRSPEYRQVSRIESPVPPPEKEAPEPARSEPVPQTVPAQPKAKAARKDTAAAVEDKSIAKGEGSERRRPEAERDEALSVRAEATSPAESRRSANESPAPAAAPPPPPPQVKAAPAPPPPVKEEKLAAVRESVTIAQQAATQGKLRVAVLNVNSVQGAKQQADPALTKDLATRLNQTPTQYALVDQKDVDRVLAEKKLTGQPLDTQTAASVGRSLGADAVIVGNVAPQVQQRPMAPGALGGFRQQQQQMSRGKTGQAKSAEQQAITAQVIDTRNASNQFTASADNLARVADQLAQFKVEGAVTDINGTVLTINIGAPAGVKTGDRFQLVRQDQVLGELRVTSTGATYSVGVFSGSGTPQAGDIARRILD